ncbi:helix-turn-helix domain-containing protein [Serratia marcescens]|jgi:AraC-like DNA-binding protein|uniref:helix-turn-helix domain-containing protein n=1 Tax=Serratia TaxID=613 RepID=UPI000D156D86|nr:MULTISPECIES: helix-turn-helix domain-containing protein [Serratia]MBH2564510.1 helix-turn-helix domain-containing protein [Serratia marcescens]MDH2269596.1 helix-turn-helix domain-containing protein [Serratia marcescens]MDH2277573.1 helix-turn-helix domain-containing protein [Serratia marcescens]PTA78340.1 AraC family transcriptional regulator [Serratia sp. Nf2]QXX98897.1 helix-turn-helix domain-containing protein [Serratia marcescens]
MTNEDIFFIEELIEWVEIHLEKRPNLDEVARISGYSKWHLQRKFKRITGIQLATYIRSRILTRAAVALRITRRSIIDISDELGFDSQQTFTRMFKQRFGTTPNRYRSMEHWDVKNLMPRFNFEASYGAGYYPEVKRLTLPEMQLVGFTRRLDFASEQELEYSSCMAMKDEIFNDFFKGLHVDCRRIYSIYSPHVGEGDELSSTLVMAVDPEHKKDILSNHQIDTFHLPSREFISINHKGSAKECLQFFGYLMSHVMPGLKDEVRGSMEMEIIQTKEWNPESKLRQIEVDYTYLISID